MDHQNPTIKVILQGEEIPGCIVNSGSKVNVISKATCTQLGIMDWEVCHFWLRMANTRLVRRLGLLRNISYGIGS